MAIFISECPVGVFALDENLEIVNSKTFPQEVRKISGKLLLIQKGELTDEHIELIENLIESGHEDFILESSNFTEQLRNRFGGANFEVETPNPAGIKLRKSIREIAKNSGFDDANELLRDANMLVTREELRREASERDKIVIQSIDAIDELDKTINTLYGRIREWYGIHFPELERHVSEHPEYFKLVSELGKRQNFTKDRLEELDIPESTAEKIQKSAENSTGADFDDLDIEAIKTTVKKIQKLQEARDKVSDYLDGLMEQVAPNMRTVVGSPIGARLISLAGGLDELAKMPSSTVQVLGAEKALFRALKKDSRPPKHGVIFQYPEIRGSPEAIRGKIARALAGKLTIAARVDAMSGKFVGDELKEDLEERIESIKSND